MPCSENMTLYSSLIILSCKMTATVVLTDALLFFPCWVEEIWLVGVRSEVKTCCSADAELTANTWMLVKESMSRLGRVLQSLSRTTGRVQRLLWSTRNAWRQCFISEYFIWEPVVSTYMMDQEHGQNTTLSSTKRDVSDMSSLRHT